MSPGIQMDALSVPIEAGLRIVLSIENASDPIESFEISKNGVLVPVQDQILDSKTLAPRPLVKDKISISKTKGSKLYSISIDLPAKQKIYVSKELTDCSISIHAFRRFVDAWYPTNIAMLVVCGKENVLYQDKRFLPGAVDQSLEVSVEEAHPKKSEASAPTDEHISVMSDFAKPRFNFKAIARGVTFSIAFVFALVAVTPLSLVHPNKLENQMSSIYLVWPARNPTVGSEVLGIDESQLIYAAQVHTNEGGIVLLKIDENYIQTKADQILGKKVIRIPLLGKLLS